MVDYYNVFFSDPEERAEVVRFSQGRDDAGNRVEKVLKQLFLESMKRVESKLCQIGIGQCCRQHQQSPGKDQCRVSRPGKCPEIPTSHACRSQPEGCHRRQKSADQGQKENADECT